MIKRLAITCLLVTLATACRSHSEIVHEPIAKKGSGIPLVFTLPNLAGDPIQLSDFRSQIVVVNYFATWCVPCQEEFPVLASLDESLEGFTVVAVSMDHRPADVLPDFLAKNPVDFPVLLANREVLEGRSPFGSVTTLPQSYLLDGQGRVVERFDGLIPVEYLRRRVHSLKEKQ